jgi:DNA polymerase-3 subunit gamma/tau
MVGQQSVVRTLVNAIQMNRTHQAYVFSGSRGIGKTSIARIFSKALRCPNVELRDGLLYSCDRCPDCIEIAAGTSVNVLEIDGASNNGVENVREIRESAKFLPSSGTIKIYIIDEVHMLSNQAFNALLKTLEEPPEHVCFIFATTEPHKIPETILGRCQRFDFKRVTVAQIMERTRDVLKSEGIDSEDAALNLIARAAEGSMRDALSILDQVISFSGSKITVSSVRDSIGLIGTELVLELLRGIFSRDAKAALAIIQDAFNQGVDLKVLLKALIEMTHALVLLQVGIEKPETQFSDDELNSLRALVAVRPLEESELIFQVFHHGLELISKASQPKLIFDLLVIKAALAESIIRIDQQATVSAPSNPRRDPRPAPQPKLNEEKAELIQKVAQAVALAPKAEPDFAAGLGFSFQGGSKAAEKPAEVKAPVVFSNEPKSWEKLIELCFEIKPVLAILLESVVEWEFPKASGDKFRIGFREGDLVKFDQLQHKAVRDQFLQLTEAYLGFKATPEGFFSKREGESMAEKNARIQRENRDQKMRMILSHQIVQEARSLFGAELTEIRMAERES